MKLISCIKHIGSCLKNTTIYCGSILVIISAVLILLHYSYVMFFPKQVIDIKSVELIYTEVQAGDSLSYRLEFCSYGQYEVTVNRRMVDGFVYTLVSSETTSPPEGCHNSILSTITIPDNTPPGEYYLEVELIYHINGLRDIIVSYQTDTFTVVK